MPNPSRRLTPRFGLLSLLGITTLVAVLLGVWSVAVRPYADQARAIDSLRRAGAELTVEAATGPGWERVLIQTSLGADAYCTVVSLSWRNADLPDDFRFLLSSLKGLKGIDLDRSSFNDQHALALSQLTDLQAVFVRYTKLTDEGAATIAKLPKLQAAFLTGNRVGDQGLQAFIGAPALKELYARWIDATPEAVAAFRTARPDCELHTHVLP